MAKRTNIEHESCRKSSNGCPGCGAQPTMWQVEYDDNVIRFLVMHHGLNTAARQCANYNRIGVGKNPVEALEDWLKVTKDKLAARKARSEQDRMFDHAVDEIGAIIRPNTDTVPADVFNAYQRNLEQLQQMCHRVVNISDRYYGISYFDQHSDGIEFRVMNKTSNVEVKLLDSLSPQEYVAIGNIQISIQEWAKAGMTQAFPISNDADVYSQYTQHAASTLQNSGQNDDSTDS
ncbi:hypothetical protein YOLOSWAG_324 [Erwinia phage vB_EamM_Yoloswag]|uniref:Uncharacterized protein n=1 Tax=Erwinia phage vB_EamM_Yoloswag TaxID=1958956 RepID=A0A1S6L3P2_9CAUD|nr:hypothetical protein HOR66_gp324 [Erwinia phage vB_EamM_Yoloswag]AQT28792.1 hypothetical protein YOLOSWAG_324 [Erwinia phage vB_EamM_Yoloswag]